MIVFVLKVILFQAVFALFYTLFLKKETFFNWNRGYLLAAQVVVLVLPLLPSKVGQFLVPSGLAFQESVIELQEVVLLANENNVGSDVAWSQAYSFLFFVGVGISLFILGRKLVRLFRLTKQAYRNQNDPVGVLRIPNSTAAFSFLNTIYFGDAIAVQHEHTIISHEQIHVKHYHAIDLFFFEVIRIAMWWNPFVYVFQKEITLQHEYIADTLVSNTEKESYAELLLTHVFQVENFSFSNTFFSSSLIKKRIVMLHKSKSKQFKKFMYVGVVPLALLLSNCNTHVEETVETIQEELQVQNVIVKEVTREELKENLDVFLKEMQESDTPMKFVIKGENGMRITFGPTNPGDPMLPPPPPGEPKKSDDIAVPFSVVENVPVFPGCENAEDPRACFNDKIQNHIMKNFNYPEQAQKEGIQGKVMVLFSIQKDGAIGDLKLNGPHELLENEAKRIIEKLPNMRPGKQRGRAVTVPFAIPISFRLQ